MTLNCRMARLAPLVVLAIALLTGLRWALPPSPPAHHTTARALTSNAPLRLLNPSGHPQPPPSSRPWGIRLSPIFRWHRPSRSGSDSEPRALADARSCRRCNRRLPLAGGPCAQGRRRGDRDDRRDGRTRKGRRRAVRAGYHPVLSRTVPRHQPRAHHRRGLRGPRHGRRVGGGPTALDHDRRRCPASPASRSGGRRAFPRWSPWQIRCGSTPYRAIHRVRLWANPVWLRMSGSDAAVAKPGSASQTAGTALRISAWRWRHWPSARVRPWTPRA